MEFEGAGFGRGGISLGEIEVAQVSSLEAIWSSSHGGGGSNKGAGGALFYKPINIPEGYFILGHHGQANGPMVVARPAITSMEVDTVSFPPLAKPSDYILVWSSESWDGKKQDNDVHHGYFWLPQPPEGYQALGILVTNTPVKPSLEEVRCARSDLTEECETDGLIWSTQHSENSFSSWNIRPKNRGVKAAGVYLGTCFCSRDLKAESTLPIACLKNLKIQNNEFSAMPSLEQVHALQQRFGPTVFFHPKETYLPSSVNWFFQNGALLYTKGSTTQPQAIDINGSNLPQGGSDDGEYWLDLPKDGGAAATVKKGDLQSAEVYVHVKPMLGGTCTDLAMWVFCPFNGPGTLKAEEFNIPLGKIGEHVGDWEHFTLRFNNFTGELWKVYLSQHSAGKWVSASDLQYVVGSNRAVIYSSKDGHANFPAEGDFLQGNTELGIGIRNDAAKSKYFVDTSSKYQIVSAEYLNKDASPQEPPWLQYMRKWGPKIDYDSKAELSRVLRFLPSKLKHAVEDFFNNDLPKETFGEEGPTGPKAKSSWEGDEKEG